MLRTIPHIVLLVGLLVVGAHADDAPDWAVGPQVEQFLLQGDEIPMGATGNIRGPSSPFPWGWRDEIPSEGPDAPHEAVWLVWVAQTFVNHVNPAEDFLIHVTIYESPAHARWHWCVDHNESPAQAQAVFAGDAPLEEVDRSGGRNQVFGRFLISSAGSWTAFRDAYMERLLAKLGQGAPPAPQRHGPEGAFYYDEATLDGYYTGVPSLRYTREQLVAQMMDAIKAYEAEYPHLTFGVEQLDSVNVAASFASGRIVTGFEDALRAEVDKMRTARPGRLLSPGDLFLCGLRACSGNVRTALITCHSVLCRTGGERNAQLVRDHLEPLRDPAGYSHTHTIMSGGVATNPRAAVGDDQQGVWYHFYGMAALEFTDRHNLTPLVAFRLGAWSMLDSSYTDRTRWFFPKSEVAGKLAAYCVEVENAQRNYQRSPADPDKMCINYTGAAAGRALSKHMRQVKPPTVLMPVRGRSGRTTVERVTLYQGSPVSIEIEGAGGERFSFDQRSQTFDGNTAEVLVVPVPEEDGTWGLVLTPDFEVSAVRWTGSDDGSATVACYSHATGRSGVYDLDVREGEALVLSDWATEPALTPEGGGGPLIGGGAEEGQTEEGLSADLLSPSSSVPGPTQLPAQGAITFACVYEQPGSLIDTVGINAAQRGDFVVLVTPEHTIRAQVFDPDLDSAGAVGNGWHAIESDPVVPGEAYGLALAWGPEGLYLMVDEGVYSLEELTTPLRGPAFLGDFPGDADWEPRFNTARGFVGSIAYLNVIPASPGQ